MGKTIIHIGMPRTASTFLQQQFFPKVPRFTLYGVETCHYSDAFQKLLYQDDSLFDAIEFEKTAEKIRSGNAILSNELFVGQSLYLSSTNRSRTARRLQRFFPEAEILLLLRNQVDLLQSLYAIGVYGGHICSPEEYIRFSDEASSIENPLYPTFAQAETTESYLYSPLIALYQSLFTKVHVFLFEDLKANPPAFAERLYQKLKLERVKIEAADKKINRSLSARQIKYTRGINRVKPILYRGKTGRSIFRKGLRTIERKVDGNEPFRFPEALREKLTEFYAEDNRKLPELYAEFGTSILFRKYYN